MTVTVDDRAQKARVELFSRCEKLDEQWLKMEGKFAKLPIPCGVVYVYHSYTVTGPDGSEGCVRDCLGIQSFRGRWRICHCSFCVWEDCPPRQESELDWTPIANCSPEVRVEAVQHLAGLGREIVEAAERFIPQVDQAIAKLSQALEADDFESLPHDDNIPF
jgi:hypothetical protein